MGSKRSLSILKRAPSAPDGMGKNAARKARRKASNDASPVQPATGGSVRDGGAHESAGFVNGPGRAGSRAGRVNGSGDANSRAGVVDGSGGADSRAGVVDGSGGADSRAGVVNGSGDASDARGGSGFRRRSHGSEDVERAGSAGDAPLLLLLPQSPVLRQSCEAVRRLVLASCGLAPGATVKTLTLGSGISAPRATHAVVSETLRFRPLLVAALAVARDAVRADESGSFSEACRRGVETMADEAEMHPETAQVLAYASALGEPPRGLNKAERLALRAKPALIAAIEAICEGYPDPAGSPSAAQAPATAPAAVSRVRRLADRWACAAGRTPHVRTMPKSVRVNALKWTVEEAAAAIVREARVQDVEMVDLTRQAEEGGMGALQKKTETTTEKEKKKKKKKNGGKMGVGERLATCEERSSGDASAGVALCGSSLHALRRSPHVPSVLLFPPSLDLHAFPPVLDGRLFLQSLASCLPAAALAPAPGSAVLDACAAPGNKTSQVAAMVGPSGRVVGLDRSPVRVRLLQGTLAKAGADRFAQGVRQDFLAVDPQHPLEVRWPASGRGPEPFEPDCVLLDPSCSGSGTKETRMDRILPHPDEDEPAIALLIQRAQGHAIRREEARGTKGDGVAASQRNSPSDNAPDSVSVSPSSPDAFSGSPSSPPSSSPYIPATAAEAARVSSLSKFQVAALRHALSFPSCRRVSYSTCSVYAAENEEVVAAVLPLAQELGWRLAHALPTWPRRGVPGLGDLPSDQAEKLIRADPDQDGTDGFFVAIFERNE